MALLVGEREKDLEDDGSEGQVLPCVEPISHRIPMNAFPLHIFFPNILGNPTAVNLP